MVAGLRSTTKVLESTTGAYRARACSQPYRKHWSDLLG